MNELQIHEIFKPIGPRLEQFLDRATIVKECNFAMQHFSKNDYLNKATTESKQQSVLNIAQIGLTLNPVLKLAYLVPRWNGAKNAVECHLEPSYQGLVKLVTDTGSAKHIICNIVYEGDDFDYRTGTTTTINHVPKFQSKDIKLVYAVATLSDNAKMVEVMTLDQVNEIRDESEGYKSFKAGKVKTAIWDSDFSEMARKTVLRRIVKYLPKTDMWDKLGQAVELDNSDYGIQHWQTDKIESLLLNANIDPEVSRALYGELSIMSSDRANKVIEYLENNQTDPITSGRNYSQSDIKKKLNDEI